MFTLVLHHQTHMCKKDSVFRYQFGIKNQNSLQSSSSRYHCLVIIGCASIRYMFRVSVQFVLSQK